MQPRLHPAMGEIVICARVARQLTLIVYNHASNQPLSPSDCAALAARQLDFQAYPMLKMALHSLAVYLGLGVPSIVWLRNVLEAAHYGHSFRRCFHWEYKENRSPYPRVTNRGVQTSPKRRVSIGLGIRDDE